MMNKLLPHSIRDYIRENMIMISEDRLDQIKTQAFIDTITTWRQLGGILIDQKITAEIELNNQRIKKYKYYQSKGSASSSTPQASQGEEGGASKGVFI